MESGRDLMEVDGRDDIEWADGVEGLLERELGVDGLEIDVTLDMLVLSIEDLLELEE